MAVGGSAGDENAPAAIVIGGGDAQIPEADVLERDVELRANGRIEIAAEIEIVPAGSERHRGMKEPGGAEIDAAKELPIALQIGMQHVVERLVRKSLQQLVKPLRTKNQQHHQPVMIGAGLGNTSGFADQRSAAIAADNRAGSQRAPTVAIA